MIFILSSKVTTNFVAKLFFYIFIEIVGKYRKVGT